MRSTVSVSQKQLGVVAVGCSAPSLQVLEVGRLGHHWDLGRPGSPAPKQNASASEMLAKPWEIEAGSNPPCGLTVLKYTSVE